MSAYPDSITAISPPWLTQVLRNSGYLAASQVTAVVVQQIGTEIGFLDNLARLSLTYDQAETGAPASLVVKVSSPEPAYRQIGDRYNAYEREFRFYEQIAPHAPLRLPRCFGREVDPQTNAHWLLLEDLGSLAAGDQVAGVTPDQAKAAVETIGRLHASWWESPRLEALTWMPHRNLQPSRYEAAWPKFREAAGRNLSAASLALGAVLGTHLERLLHNLEQRPHTIVHGDFRADNLLFDHASGPQSVVVLDWQLAIRGKGILDIARFLCGSLQPHDRAACEMDLLQRWHATLEQGGVRDYSFPRAVEDYRTSALLCLYYPVTIHAAEEAAGTRGTALAHAQIERFFTAAEELSTSSLL